MGALVGVDGGTGDVAVDDVLGGSVVILCKGGVDDAILSINGWEEGVDGCACSFP